MSLKRVAEFGTCGTNFYHTIQENEFKVNRLYSEKSKLNIYSFLV